MATRRRATTARRKGAKNNQPVARELPTGTVTFLFTDVEGSTRLLRQHGDAYPALLAEHRRLLREAFGRHEGVEVDTQGDGSFAAFTRATDAIAAAREAQAALAETPVRVRMAIHTGEPILTDEGYVGIDVHKGARVAAAGHGGQVLVSEQTARLAGDDELRDLGAHRLKDLTAPERIYQLGSRAFPPLKTLDASNLPVAANPLIGRDAELGELIPLLRDETRVVTVTGAGGTGKTRLALQAAAEVAGDFPDGVFWIPLQALADADLVLATVAEAVGARDGLATHVRERRMLLLLDSLEHLLPAAPALAELVADCPELRLLVTSRAPLRIAAEREVPLEPLDAPGASELFVELARAAGRRLEPDATVAAICRRLDNLPLALELAAARTRVLEPGALLGRLERALPVLTGGRRDAPERQRTLRATIEWSHDLLERDARRLFARIGVFAGSFSLEAVEEVCDADLDALTALVELSLLKSAGDGRFVLLETIREYALEQLDGSDEEAAVRRRHADFFLAFAERASRARGTVESIEALGRDHDNIRGALAWLDAAAEVERELRLAVAVTQFRWVRSHLREHRHLLLEALANAHDVDPGVLADARASLAQSAFFLGDTDEWRRSADESVRLARALGDERRIEWALRLRTFGEHDLGERRRLLGAAEGLARGLGDDGALAWVLHMIGLTAAEEGGYTEARSRLEESLALNRTLGRAFETANTLSDLGFVAVSDGRFELARDVLREALRTALELRATDLAAACLVWIAPVALEYGDAPRAARLLGAAARVAEETGTVFEPMYHPLQERTNAEVQRALGNGFEREWAAGGALSLAEAAVLALGES